MVYLTIKYVSVFTTQKAVPQSKTSYSNIIKYMPNTTCEKSVHAQAHHQMSNVTDTEKSGNKDHIFKASGLQTTVAVSVATWRRHSSTCCALGEMPVNLGFYTQPTTRCCSFRYATLFTFLSTLFPGAPREKAPLKQRGKFSLQCLWSTDLASEDVGVVSKDPLHLPSGRLPGGMRL